MNIQSAISRSVNLVRRAANALYRANSPKNIMRPTLRGTIMQARRGGFEPRTVIDVGVAWGTQPLYNVFPNAHHVLIEPLEEFRPIIENFAKKYQNMELITAAASNKSGTMTFHLHSNLGNSSLYRENNTQVIAREVPTVTLDDVCQEHHTQGPYLIKLDAEGAELDILEGATRVLSETEYLILEVALFGHRQGAPQFYDVVQYMKERGFVVYDVVQPQYRPLDQAIIQMDVAFVKEEGMFRQQHVYAAEGQDEVRGEEFKKRMGQKLKEIE